MIKLDILKRAALGALPLAGFAAYWSGQYAVLFALTLVLPALLTTRSTVSNMVGLAKPHDKSTLISALTIALDNPKPLQKTACILLEVDDFEQLQAQFGSTAMEDATNQIVARISSLTRIDDITVHLSPGRFGLAVPHVRIPEQGAMISLIKRLQKHISEPMIADGASLHLSVSAAFCIDTQLLEKSADQMFNAAQSALIDAKRFAPSGIRAFSSKTPVIFEDTTEIAKDALRALKDGEITAWFQPQISTDTGKVTGFEALARWAHPQKGVLLPSEFLPALEAGGHMEELTETILQHAIQALLSWDKSMFNVPSVAVNFATQELRNPSLVERIKWDVDRYDLDPSRLTVEILETVISDASDDIITRNIRALSQQGFRIDLDDFGTGHASLANIHRFNVDRVKIDRSFVTRAEDDPTQQRMISAIVGMAEQLQIETLAEGVETVGEYSLLSQLGCNHLQGYAIAKPMPLADTLIWLEQQNAKLGKTLEIRRRIK